MSIRQVAAVFVVALMGAPLASSATGVGREGKAVIYDSPSLTINPAGGLGTSVDLRLNTSPTAAGVAQVALYVPAGYTMSQQAPGTAIGLGFAFSISPSGDSSPWFGRLTVVDPATVEPAAQACDPAPHVAVWMLGLENSNSTVTQLPLFVDAPGANDPVGTSYKIQFCPMFPADARLGAASILLQASALVPPRASGSYLWRAFMTPFGVGSTRPDPAQTYEFRALVPVPQILTLNARYDPKTHRAILSGQATELGRPKVGVEVTFHAHSAHVESANFGPAKTDTRGRYSITWPISERTDFTASIDPGEPVPCPADPAPPPGGCGNLTRSAPADQDATVRLPRRTDPKLAVTSVDRALAARVNLQLSDFPAGWTSLPTSANNVVPCPNDPPDESKLTLTGSSYSPAFINGAFFTDSSVQIVFSVVKLWKTPADATVAYAREAPTVQLRCILNDPETTILKAGPLHPRRLGRGSRAFRVIAQDREPDEAGKQHVSYLDLYEILGQRSLTTMIFISTDTPLTLESTLTQAVARRASRV